MVSPSLQPTKLYPSYGYACITEFSYVLDKIKAIPMMLSLTATSKENIGLSCKLENIDPKEEVE